MAGRSIKARPPFLFRSAGGSALATRQKNICRFGSRLGEIQETSERLTQTNVAVALNGLGELSACPEHRSGALEVVRWPGSYTFV
jgi:hypothetical protein